MFDKFKELAKLKKMKDILEKEVKEVERQGVKVVVNGKMEIQEIKLNPELEIEEQERIIKECFNQALAQIQQEAAKTMFQI
jgi:DNA-binding protein YbaB